MMKLAISNIAWQPEENDRVISVLKKLSVKGIEVAPTLLFENPAHQPGSAVQEVRRFWNDNGIEIVAMQSLLFGHPEMVIFGDRETRRRTIEYIKRIIELAGSLGAKALVFGSPKNRKKGSLAIEETMEIASTFFSTLAETASSCGTCLCIEPNPPDYDCDFITGMTEAIELVERIAHPGFGLHVDSGAMTLNREACEQTLDAAFPHMRHFHISEPFLMKTTGAKTNHQVSGRHLRALGYRGWVSIEMRKGLGESNPEVVEKCLRYAQEMYLER